MLKYVSAKLITIAQNFKRQLSAVGSFLGDLGSFGLVLPLTAAETLAC